MSKSKIIDIFKESGRVKNDFAQKYSYEVVKVAGIIINAIKEGKKILIFGNGGSAADSQHFAAELVNRFLKDRAPIAAIALSTDTSIITSIGNDSSFDNIFARQIQALGERGDIAIAISTSGDSINVILGINIAKQRGMTTVGFTGGEGGKLSRIADYAFVVPDKNTPRIQETHITLIHVLCELIEEGICGGKV